MTNHLFVVRNTDGDFVEVFDEVNVARQFVIDLDKRYHAAFLHRVQHLQKDQDTRHFKVIYEEVFNDVTGFFRPWGEAPELLAYEVRKAFKEAAKGESPKIMAVLRHRQLTGSSLREAKEYVESLIA